MIREAMISESTMVPSLSKRRCFTDMRQKQKTATEPGVSCGSMKITVGGSLSMSEVQYGTAVVEHENHRDEEKQAHQDVENAVSLATRVFNFVHIVRKILWC